MYFLNSLRKRRIFQSDKFGAYTKPAFPTSRFDWYLLFCFLNACDEELCTTTERMSELHFSMWLLCQTLDSALRATKSKILFYEWPFQRRVHDGVRFTLVYNPERQLPSVQHRGSLLYLLCSQNFISFHFWVSLESSKCSQLPLGKCCPTVTFLNLPELVLYTVTFGSVLVKPIFSRNAIKSKKH